MIKTDAPTDEEKTLMAQYNIKTETRTLFYAQGYKYDKLKDALRYAKLSVERQQAADKDEASSPA